MAPQLLLDPEQNFAHTKQRVVEALQSHFPVRGAVQTLDIENVHVADNLPHDDVTAQHQAKVTGASWTVPVYGTAVIRDTATGEVKKKSKIRLMDLPKLTNRFSYIVDGQEYQLDHQWQLRPGAYTRRRDNGELETRFNTVGKPAFDMLFDPNKRTFHVEYGTSKVPLYPWLKAMGVSDQQMQASWGKDIYEANKNARGNDTALQRLFKSRTGKEATAEEAKKFLQDTLAQSKLDPQTTETTLGKGFTEVTGDALHLATEKLLKVHGGHPEDSRDALPFKKLRSAGDYIFDKIQAAAPATRLKVLRNLNSAATPGSLLQKGYFEAPLRSAFHTNAAARVAAQINPLDMLSGASSTTILGIGGIQSERAITQEAKMIDASHLGFLDPLHTPEGPRTGVSLRLPVSVVKDGDDVKIPLHNIHTNRTEYLTPAQVQKATVVFPDQVTWEGGKPKPIAAKVLAAAEGNEARHVHFGEAQYVMPHASQGYSITSNLVPFLSSNSGGRIGMADRHMEQAISLVHREVPLVQTGVGAWDAAHDTFEKAIGHQVAHTAPIDGTVKKITSTHILLQGKDGTEKKVHLYKNYPLNDAKSVLNSTPVVKEGDKVKAGQLISDTNYTKDGHLALGLNLKSVTGDTLVLWWDSGVPRLTRFDEILPVAGMSACTIQPEAPFREEHLPVRAFIAHETTEEVLRVKTLSGRTVDATKSHSFVVFSAGSLLEKKPEELARGVWWLPRLCTQTVPEVLHSIVLRSRLRQRTQELSPAFGRLLGFYLAEGHAHKAHVQFAASDRGVQQHIVDAAVACGLGTATVTDTSVIVYAAELAEHLRVEAGHLAQNKKIPSYVFGASKAFREAVLGGYWAGDGTVVRDTHGGPHEASASTASRRLRDGLVLLCATLGIDTTLRDYPQYGRRWDGSTYKHCWVLRIATRSFPQMPFVPHAEKEKRIREEDGSVRWDMHDQIPLWAEVLPALKKAVREKGITRASDAASLSYWRSCYSQLRAARTRLISLLQDMPRSVELEKLYRVATNQNVAWDRVESVTPQEYRGLVYDFDMGKNPNFSIATGLIVHNTAYLPWHGYNFEDAVTISASAAKRLTSEHMSKPALGLTQETVLNKKSFQHHFPLLFPKTALEKLDDDGVVRVGQKVAPGEPLVLATSPYDLKDRTGITATSKWLRGAHNDNSLRWESEHPGEVVAVHRTPQGIQVHVRTQEPATVADKISFRHGNKGVIGQILPDHEMPKDKEGKPFEVLINPTSVGGRVNPGQLYTTVASKIAEKTGKPYVVNNFEPGVDYHAKVLKELKEHGLSDTEEVFDPKTGHSLGQVLTGKQYGLKLVHQVEKKSSVRTGMAGLPGLPSGEGSDSNLQPSRGGGTGGQAVGVLGVYALLAHGALHNLREMQTLKSESDDPETDPKKKWPSLHNQTWAALQTGAPIPTPKPTFAFDKFLSMLKGAGINTTKEGHSFIASPLTDKHILEMAGGRTLKDPTAMVWATKKVKGSEDLRPRDGGLFDEKLTGGHGGRMWSAIKLHEPIPNPVFEKPIRVLTGLKDQEFEDVLSGNRGVNLHTGALVDVTHKDAVTGGHAIKGLLDKIDVAKALPAAEQALQTAKGAELNKSLQRVQYLRALKKLDMSPAEAYVLNHVPVLPPVIRPITALPTGDLKVADVNFLYSKLAQTNNMLGDKTLQANWTEDRKAKLRKSLYENTKSLFGVGVTFESGKERGILQQISGTTPKTGFVQDTLANRRQDLTMRTTIVPGPQLGLDEVGIPEKHAMSLFQPFVVRQLVQQGSARSPLDAQKLIADKHPDTKAALEKVMAARPVLVKRDPVLHQYGIQGHMPKLVSGDAIQLHPLHTAGYNADHDGDTMAIFVPVTADAVAEAKRMLPSQHLISAASNKLMYVPSLEYAYGVYKLSQKGAETDKKFKTPGEILQAYHKGDLKHSDVVKLNDKATTAGRVLISTALPEDFRHDVLHSLDKPLDVKATGTLLTSVAKKHTADYDMYANRLKDLGAGAATGLVKLPLWAPEKADIFDAAAAKGMSGTNVKQMATQGTFQPRGMQVAAPATQHLIFKTPTLTLSLNDIAPDRGARDSVLRKTQTEVDGIYNRTDIDRAEKDRRAIQAWSRADEEMTKLHNTLQDIKQKTDPEAAGNLYNLYKAGVKPSGAQYKQFALAPMLMKDSRNRVIATPIQRSYSEGLSFGEFWTGMHGARRGAVMKVQEVQEPGALTKLLVNTSMDQLVSHHDCGTDQGLQLPASSPAAQDRYLAKPVTAGGKTYAAGTLLTPDVLSHLRTAAPATQLQVRSPVRCEHDKGVCQKCMGVRLLGQAPDLGTNVGIQAAQAIGERAVQLTLKEFHCMHEHSTVLVREAGNVYHTTLGRLFARGGNATTTADGEEVRTLLGVEVWDVDGWTVVKSARRHPQQHGTAMVLARTRSGFGILSQDNHPHMMRVNSAVCGSCGTYPKRDKGGRFRCRKCKFVWPKAPEAPDALQMVEPQEMGIKTHRAVLAQEPKATPAAAPLRSGWLAGMYCAEGFVLVRKEGEKKRPYVVGVGFGQNPGKLARRLGKEIKKEHGSLPGYTGKEFQLYSTEIGAAYQATFGRYSRNKGLPDGWGGLPACWLNDFVAGLFDGDGTFSSTEDSRWFTARIDTTSFLLAQQVQAILRDRGVHARIILTPRRKLSRHQGFGVTFPFTERAAGVLAASLKARKAKAKPVQNAERFADTVDYIRPVYFATPPLVYDLETASHTLYVGRVLTHNTGGVATGGSNAVNAFTRFQQLVNLPEKLPNASTLAMKAGTITKVDTDATGTRVTIDGTVHHVGKDAQGNSLAHAPAGAFSTPGYAHWTPPTVGMKVQAGQTLSDPNRTVVNPHDLLAATGSIRAVQNHLVDEIHGIYASEGVDRKHVEVLVRAMTGVAQVKDSHHPDFLRGDTYKTATIEAVNRELVAQNKKPIEYQPVLTGVAQLPHLNQGENWMGRLFHRNLRSVLSDAAALGHASDIHGTHPGPGVLYGAELGLNEKDSLKPGMAHLKNVPKWKY